jgi:putative ABC transport system substrate-binding protein
LTLWVVPFARAEKMVLVVLSRTLAPYQEALKGFEQDGRFSTTVINLEGDATKVGLVQNALGNNKPEAMLVLGTDALNAIKNTACTVPVAYSMVLEPMELPGKKASGVIMQIPIADQFNRISKLLPNVKKIGVLYNPNFSKKTINQAREIVGQFGITLIPIAIENPTEISGALTNLTKDKVDAIWSVVDNIVAQPAVVGKTIEHAQNQKLPFIGLSVFHVKAGALAAFSVDYADIGKQSSDLISKMLAGSSIGKVESPRKVIVFVNDNAQKQMGLDLSGISDVQVMR